MAENKWQYWLDDLHLPFRTCRDKAEVRQFPGGKWVPYDYKAAGYLEIGDGIWCTDYNKCTEKEAEYFFNHF